MFGIANWKKLSYYGMIVSVLETIARNSQGKFQLSIVMRDFVQYVWKHSQPAENTNNALIF